MRTRRAFTLIEVMSAMLIMSIATALIAGTFFAIIQGTTDGEEMLRDLHHGEYSMTQLVSALRSTAYFTSQNDQYGFWLEDDTSDGQPADIISWVTSSSAFMPPGSEVGNGLHRIAVSIEEDDEGQRGLAVTAYPHVINPEHDDFEPPEPWIVSRRIIGLDCQVYSVLEQEWKEEWEQINLVPTFVRLILVLKPNNEDDDPTELTQVVPIPVGTFARNRNRFGGDQNPQNPDDNTPAPDPSQPPPGAGDGEAFIPPPNDTRPGAPGITPGTPRP